MQCEMKLLCPHSILGFAITLCCYKCSVFYMLGEGRCWWSGHSWGKCHCSLLCSRCWSWYCFFGRHSSPSEGNCSYSPHYFEDNTVTLIGGLCVFCPAPFFCCGCFPPALLQMWRASNVWRTADERGVHICVCFLVIALFWGFLLLFLTFQ